MPQEHQFQWPAFQDIVKLCPPEEATIPPPGIRLKSSPERNFTIRGRIPLGWFRNEAFRRSVEEQFGNLAPTDLRIQLVFNTTPMIRVIKHEKDGKVYDERQSNPEIIIWTSLGGWCATREDQSFKGPGWTTKFIQL